MISDSQMPILSFPVGFSENDLQAASSLSNVSPILSSGLIFSSLSISRRSGGVFGAERNSSIASFQSMLPAPGHRCEFFLHVVMDMGGLDVRTQDLKCFRHAAHQMSMAEIETDANVGEMRSLDEFNKFIRRRQVIWDVFKENAHAERLGKSAQVFDRGHRGFKFVLVERIVAHTQVLNEKTKWNLLGNFSARLILSIASIRAERSVEAIFSGGAPARPNS